MIAAYLNGARNIELREEKIPEINDTQVLVNIKSIGICGSDIHYYEHGRIGPFIATEPLILGHESAGVVVKVGNKVKHIKEGTRVSLEPGVPCGRCENCKRGRYNLCPDIFFMASAPHEHGAFREYIAYDANFIYPIPDNISFDEGAMMEPLAAAIFALRRADIKPGSSIVILGAGPIGLLIIQLARASGAIKIIVSDVNKTRLKLAEEFGATFVIDVSRTSLPDKIASLTYDHGADIVIEAAGHIETHKLCLEIAKRGGTIVFVGWTNESLIPLDVHKIGVKELDVRGMFRYCNTYPEAISLVSSGRVNVNKLITHKYKLQDVEKAILFAAKRSEGTIKIVVNTE